MSVKVKVEGLGEDPGKEEEKKVVRDLVDRFRGKQWYLSSLFTTELLAWFEQKVADDWPCDLMGELEGSRKEAVSAVANTYRLEAQIERERVEHDLKHSTTCQGYEAEVKGLKGEVEILKASADGWRKDSRELREECVRQGDRINELGDENRELAWANTELKARLYDLMQTSREDVCRK